MERLAVIWESGRLSREIQAAFLLNLKGAGGGMCWCRGVIFFISKTPLLPCYYLWKWMCQAEIFGNQSSAWLIYCCVNRDQVPGMSESSPQSVIAFASMSFSFHLSVFFPVPTHLEFATRECPMAPRRASKGRRMTQGSRAESLPGLTISSDLCKSKRAFSALIENSIC